MNLQCVRCSKSFERPLKDVNRGRVKYCSRVCSDEHKKEKALIYAKKVIQNDKKQCKACDATKPLSSFPKSKDSYTGYFSYCIECRRDLNRAQDKKRWSEKKEKLIAQRRNAHLRREFGITTEHYEQLLNTQKGVCAICKESKQYKLLAVDHDHTTGIIRGILCENCNRALGMFKDDENRLQNAIEYLKANG